MPSLEKGLSNFESNSSQDSGGRRYRGYRNALSSMMVVLGAKKNTALFSENSCRTQVAPPVPTRPMLTQCMTLKQKLGAINR